MLQCDSRKNQNIKDHCQRKDFYLKIDSSYVGMESARSYQATSTRRLSFFVQLGNAGLNSDVNTGLDQGLNNEKNDPLEKQQSNEKTKEDKLDLENTKQTLEELQNRMSPIGRLRHISKVNLGEEERALESIRQQCILYLWSLLFGGKKAEEMAEKMGMSQNRYSSLSSPNQMDITQSLPMLTPGQFTIVGQEEVFYTEQESTGFSTNGVVKTADGREISFGLDLQMSRSFSKYTNTTVANIGSFIDPLVINLNGNIAGVSDQKFYFDLDADGEEEAISRLCEDSGYLALDKNDDGKINDGSELFGTKSGDGFADLAKYDQDGNGWIDENDAIFDKLKIWVQDADGTSHLFSLKEKGVGAICLKNASTDFTQKNETGEVNAAIRRTGIFLYENGGVGSMQHMDLAVNQ